MAEVYKGLTIEIGADASRLVSELKKADSAISSTQKALREVERALKLDPSDSALLSEKLRLTADRAGELGTRLKALQAIESTASAEAKEFAARVGNTATALETAKAGYNDVNARLKALNERFAEAGLGSKEFLGYLAKKHNVVLETCEDVEQLSAALAKAGVTEREFRDGLRGQSTANSAIAKTVSEIRQLMPLYEQLSAEHKAWQERLSQAQGAASFQKLQRDVSATAAELRQAALAAASLDAKLRMESLLSSPYEGFASDLRTAGTACERLADECARLKRAAEIDDTNLKTFRAAAESTAEAVAACRERAVLLERQLDALGAAAGDELSLPMVELERKTAKAEESVRGLVSRLAEAKERLAALEGKAGLDGTESELREARIQVEALSYQYEQAAASADKLAAASKFREVRTALAETRAQAEALSESMSKVAKVTNSVKNAGYGLYSTVTPALTMAAYGVVSRTEEIDSAYRDMRKTLNAEEEDYQRLYKNALKYSETHVTSAADMLSTEALLAQVGVSPEMVEEVAEVVSNLDIATSLDADELSTQLGQLITTMKIGEGGAASFGDSLVRLGNNMATNETQIMDVLSYMGSAATLYGFTADETLAWAAAMASTGQGAEASGGAFSRVMAQVETAAAAGGDSLKAFASTAGMTNSEFAKLWANDPSSAMRALVEGLAEIDAAGGSVELTLQELGITNTRDKQLMRALTQEVYSAAGGQGVLADALEMSKDAWDGVSDEWGQAGDAANEADKKAEGFSGTLSTISNNLDVLAASLGEACTPILNVALGAIQGLTQAVDGLPQGFVTGAEGVALLVAALGPCMVAVASVTEAFQTMGKVVASVSPQLVAAIKGLGALKTAGVVVALAAVAAVIGTVASAAAEARERQEALTKASEGLKKAMSGGDWWLAFARGASQAADAADELAERIDATVESQGALADSIAQTTADLETQAAVAGGCVSALRGLSDQGGVVSAGDYAEASTAVSTLNDELGTNVSLVKDAQGNYQLMSDGAKATAESIDTLAKSVLRQSESEAMAEAYKETYKSMLEAEAEYESAHEAFVEKYGEPDDLQLDILAGATLSGFGDWGEYKKLADNLNESKTLYEGASDAVEAYRKTYGELEEEQDGACDVAAELTTLQGGLRAALSGAAGAAGDAAAQTAEDAEAAEELASNIETATEKLGELNSEHVGLGTYLQEQGYGLDTFAEALVTAGYDVEEFASDYEAAVSTIQSSSLLSDEQGDDAWTRLSTQWANNDFYAQWTSDMAALKEYAAGIGDDSARALAQSYIQTLEDEGPSSETAVQGFIADPSSFDSMVAAYGESYRIAGNSVVQGYIQGINEYKDAASAAAQQLFSANSTAAEIVSQTLNLDGVDVESQVAAFYDALSQALANGSFAGNEELQAKAQELVDAYTQGVAATDSAGLSQALYSIVQAALSSTDYSAAQSLEVATDVNVTPTEVTLDQDAVASAAQGGGEAITVTSPVTVDPSSVDVSALNESLAAAGSESGAYLSQGVAQGVADSASQAEDAASAMGAQAVDAMNSGLGVASPSTYGIQAGGYLDEGVAQGISSSASVPVDAAASMAEQVRSQLSSLPDDASTWGYELGANFASGISSTTEAAENAASALASAVSKYIHHSVPDKGPLSTDDLWGGELVSNFAGGMLAGLSDVRRAAARVAAAADVSAYETAWGMASGSLGASRASMARAGAAESGRALTQDEIRGAVAQGMAESAASIEASVYVDGRRLAQATSKANDRALGKLSARRGR